MRVVSLEVRPFYMRSASKLKLNPFFWLNGAFGLYRATLRVEAPGFSSHIARALPRSKTELAGLQRTLTHYIWRRRSRYRSLMPSRTEVSRARALSPRDAHARRENSSSMKAQNFSGPQPSGRHI
jgi:hypothetical protein